MTPAAGKFFWFLLFMVETLLYFTYYGVVCVAITPNLLAAAVASNSLYLTMNLFSGFVIPAPVCLCLFFLISFFFLVAFLRLVGEKASKHCTVWA